MATLLQGMARAHPATHHRRLFPRRAAQSSAQSSLVVQPRVCHEPAAAALSQHQQQELEHPSQRRPRCPSRLQLGHPSHHHLQHPSHHHPPKRPNSLERMRLEHAACPFDRLRQLAVAVRPAVHEALLASLAGPRCARPARLADLIHMKRQRKQKRASVGAQHHSRLRTAPASSSALGIAGRQRSLESALDQNHGALATRWAYRRHG
mmetsp:Transcript_8456/g.17549  ORF Transcript_8456/g.17549 Transcript_8456/m.17549 type:complete len:207 (-) Transcript_8456:50-670(-)